MKMTGDDLLWNWARWCWSGKTVGNMEPYIPQDDNHRQINFDHALAVEQMHRRLPHHEGMVIIAEYPQKNHLFLGLHDRARCDSARRWIGKVTGVWLNENEYKLYLGLFKDQVGGKLL